MKEGDRVIAPDKVFKLREHVLIDEALLIAFP